MTDKTFTGWAFVVLFALAFLFMGTLAFALEGYKTAAAVCGWLAMGLLVTATACSIYYTLTARK